MQPAKKASKRVIWRSGRLFSLRLKDGKFALLQMLDIRGRVAVFRHFRTEDVWEDLELREDDILFFTLLTRAVLLRSSITLHQTVPIVAEYDIASRKISADGFRKATFCLGTDNQRDLLVPSTDLRVCVAYRNGAEIIDYSELIETTDYDRFSHLEMTNLSDYPTFNERLYLCAKIGRNFDPLKELAFDRPIGIECATYLDIISGKVRLDSLGY